jgi:hypothetical protein
VVVAEKTNPRTRASSGLGEALSLCSDARPE